MQKDHAAQAALSSLQTVQSKLEVGVPYIGYLDSVASANFAVHEYLSSESAKRHVAFGHAVQDALKWYKAGADMWQMDFKRDFLSGKCDSNFESYQVKDLCGAYPELVEYKADPSASVSGNEMHHVLVWSSARRNAWDRADNALDAAKRLSLSE